MYHTGEYWVVFGLIGWSIVKQTRLIKSIWNNFPENYLFTFSLLTDVVHAHATIIHSRVGVWIIVGIFNKLFSWY